MKCPRCSASHMVSRRLPDGPAALECKECAGSWVDGPAYRQWLEWGSRNTTSIESQAASTAVGPEPNSALLCSTCSRIMLKCAIGKGLTFSVDRCGECGGMWFDPGEWEALQAKNMHVNIPAAAAPAYQRELERQASRTRMQDLYRSQFGEGVFDELMRIRKWIEAQPDSRRVLNFLVDRDPFEA